MLPVSPTVVPATSEKKENNYNLNGVKMADLKYFTKK